MTTPKRKKPGHPKLPDDQRRVHLTCTVAPTTATAIEDMAKAHRISKGRVLDMFAEISAG